ncbi:hypothetical protein DEO72_LG1g2307 [Vigna unguiculata]|uniref:Uncharacterized protein n=1 Tax=Vigna unguiculata TaxID=3917 RepID=A0A4D6KW21_VIGUN|nr:hypothetical protein DEO72_LG1g2307 [Vigna unguiculata]
MICPLLPSIADCASVHEVRVAGLALPPNSRRKGSRFRHHRATVPPSLWPPSHHRRTSVAPPCAPPSRHLCCVVVAPPFARTSRSPSIAPSLRRALCRASVFQVFQGRVLQGNPSRYKDMVMDELSAGDKEVVEILLKFVDKLPTKGLVRVYNSVHPIIDIEGHMAQSGKKNLALFQSLRKEMAAKAKAAGKTDIPNLQESVVEVHVHGGMKRKAELPPRHGKGKDVKRVRAALLGPGSASGAGSASGEKGPESGRWSSLEARP